MKKFILSKSQFNTLIENKKRSNKIINELREDKMKLNSELFENHFMTKTNKLKNNGIISENDINILKKELL